MSGQGYQVGKTFSIPTAFSPPTVNLSIGGTTGGSLSQVAYSIKYTYVTSNGETSPNSGQTLTPSGANNALTITSPSSFPTGVNAINIYVALSSQAGQESFQSQITTPNTTFTLNSLSTTGKPIPQWNWTSYQDINPSTLGLSGGNEFIIHNVYYNNPVAIAIYDGTNLVAYDGDTTNGGRLGMSIHCNNSQWLRVSNQGTLSNVQIAFDGIQTV